MGAPVHFDGKRMAGTHTTVIDGASPVLETILLLFPKIRIQNGYIEAGIGAKGQSIKITKLPTAIQMVIVIKSSKQTFIIYGECELEKINETLKNNKKIRGFTIRANK